MVLEVDVKLPSQGIRLQVANTMAFISNESHGTGTLCIAESNLIWRKDNGNGLCLEYPHVALHAISNDLQAFPHECIYVMLDKNILSNVADENRADLDDNDDEDEDCSSITEIRFVPEDKTILNQLFQEINRCQALHPDEQLSNSDVEDEEDNGYVDDEDGVDEGIGNGNDDTDYHIVDIADLDEGNTNDNVELSVRGRQILDRIQISYQPGENGDSKMTGEHIDSEQFEDAD